MRRFQPRSALPVGIALIVVGALGPVVHLLSAGWPEASLTVALGTACAGYGFLAYLRPAVEVDETAVTIRNVLTTVHIPFLRVAYVDTRWALEIYTDAGRKVSAFAAPAPGVWTARQTSSAELTGLHPDTYVGGGARIGDRAGTPSGDAAALVREALAQWRAHHPDALADQASPRIVRRLNTEAAAGLALVLVAAIAAVTA